MHYTLDEALPRIYIQKNANDYDVHWDSRSVEADEILDEYREYIEGFLDGCSAVFSIGYKAEEASWGHRTGYVKRLPLNIAEQLEKVVRGLLHSLVERRYKELESATE